MVRPFLVPLSLGRKSISWNIYSSSIYDFCSPCSRLFLFHEMSFLCELVVQHISFIWPHKKGIQQGTATCHVMISIFSVTHAKYGWFMMRCLCLSTRRTDPGAFGELIKMLFPENSFERDLFRNIALWKFMGQTWWIEIGTVELTQGFLRQ